VVVLLLNDEKANFEIHPRVFKNITLKKGPFLVNLLKGKLEASNELFAMSETAIRASSTHSSLNSKESECATKRRSDTSAKTQGMNSIQTSNKIG